MDYKYQKELLPNGLTFVQVHQPHMHSVSLAVFVRSGSRFEAPGQNGISHFLEHMLFRGTPRYPSAFDLNVGFENLGGTLGGATSPDCTELAIALPRESICAAADILCEVVSLPLFTEMDTERRIISEEIREDLDEHDQPVDIDYLTRSRMWPDHPLGQSVTGSIENVNGFSKTDLELWFQSRFVAENMIVCVAGAGVDAAVADLIRHRFGSIRRGNGMRARALPADDRAGGRFSHVHRPGSQTQIRLSFFAPGIADPDYTDLEMLLRVIDDGMSTPLHRRIFENRALAYNISAGIECYEDVGAFSIDAVCSHDNVAALLDESLDIVAGIRDEGVAEEMLHRARARAIWSLRDFQDSPAAMCSWYGEQQLLGAIRRLEDVVLAIEHVSVAGIQAMARRVFNPSALFVTTVGVQSDRQRARLESSLARFRGRL